MLQSLEIILYPYQMTCAIFQLINMSQLKELNKYSCANTKPGIALKHLEQKIQRWCTDRYTTPMDRLLIKYSEFKG